MYSNQNAGNCRTCQTVVDTLCRGQGNPKGRGFCVEQGACPHALHNGQTNSFGFAGTVEFFPHGIDSIECIFSIGFQIKELPGVFQIFRQKIICRIDTEHDHVNGTGIHCAQTADRVMGTDAKGFDDPLFF